jgi:predicted transcriptional regulator of viral defense system
MDTNTLLTRLKNKGIVTTKELTKHKISEATLSRLVKSGQLERLTKGLYIHPESTAIKPEDFDFIFACTKFGRASVIGGITALFHYDLIEQVPTQIWVIVKKGTRTKDKRFRLIPMDKINREGIIQNKNYRITSIERTIVEAFVYANRIGLRTAIEAITRAIKRKLTTINKISNIARKMKQEKALIKNWEAITGAISA